MTLPDMNITPSHSRSNAGNINDAGGFNQRNEDFGINENNKTYIAGTGSYPTGIPIGDSSKWGH